MEETEEHSMNSACSNQILSEDFAWFCEIHYTLNTDGGQLETIN